MRIKVSWFSSLDAKEIQIELDFDGNDVEPLIIDKEEVVAKTLRFSDNDKEQSLWTLSLGY